MPGLFLFEAKGEECEPLGGGGGGEILPGLLIFSLLGTGGLILPRSGR
jgi:hypothetical protein